MRRLFPGERFMPPPVLPAGGKKTTASHRPHCSMAVRAPTMIHRPQILVRVICGSGIFHPITPYNSPLLDTLVPREQHRLDHHPALHHASSWHPTGGLNPSHFWLHRTHLPQREWSSFEMVIHPSSPLPQPLIMAPPCYDFTPN